jgi:hypothetical protein
MEKQAWAIAGGRIAIGSSAAFNRQRQQPCLFFSLYRAFR